MNDQGFHGFGKDAVPFLAGLAKDNSKAYWESRRETYQAAIAAPLQALGNELEDQFGEPKIFRPYRDLRFTPDKRPYQEYARMGFWSPETHDGGLYLQLGADGLLLGSGWYEPGRDQLERFRALQDDAPKTRALDELTQELADAGFPLSDGAPVKTAPRGWARDHPRIEWIRRTQLVASQTYPPDGWLVTDECFDVIADAFGTLNRWNRWLRDNVGPSHAAPRMDSRRPR